MQWLRSNSLSFSTRAMKNLEQVLEETEVNDTTVVFESRFVTLLHKPDGLYKGLEIYASDKEVSKSHGP